MGLFRPVATYRVIYHFSTIIDIVTIPTTCFLYYFETSQFCITKIKNTSSIYLKPSSHKNIEQYFASFWIPMHFTKNFEIVRKCSILDTYRASFLFVDSIYPHGNDRHEENNVASKGNRNSSIFPGR